MIPLPFDELQRAFGLPPRQGSLVTGVVFDHREARPGTVFVGLKGSRFDGAEFAAEAIDRGAELALCGPAAPAHPQIVRDQDPRGLLVRLAALVRAHYAGPVVAITGSVGKTTVQKFMVELSNAVRPTVGPPRSFNNREGVARTILLLEALTELLVLEVGTNARGEIADLARLARPTAAVLTAIAPTHLAGLGSLDGVLREKTSLALALQPGAPLFVNADDPRLAAYARSFGPRAIPISLDPTRRDAIAPAEVLPQRLIPGPGLDPIDHALDSEVQVRNLWIAWVVANHFGGAADRLRAAARALRVPALRGEQRPIGRAQVILDCWNASPEAVRAALKDLARRPGRRVAILGDMLELGAESLAYHEAIAREAAALDIDEVIHVGQFGEPFVRCAKARTFRDALAARPAFHEATAGADWVLLKGSRGIGLEKVLEQDHA